MHCIFKLQFYTHIHRCSFVMWSMLMLIGSVVFSSSPSPIDSSLGCSASNAGESSQPVMGVCSSLQMEVVNYPTPQDLAWSFLWQIPQVKPTRPAVKTAEDVLTLINELQMSPLLAVNALLKRMREVCPTSAAYIDYERDKQDPKSPYPNGRKGPTPEILLNAVKMYTSTEFKVYRDLIKNFFQAQMQQFLTLSAEVEEFLANINHWIDDVQKARERVLPQKGKTRLITPNQLSRWMKNGMSERKPWRF
jgi:hypothetical protein